MIYERPLLEWVVSMFLYLGGILKIIGIAFEDIYISFIIKDLVLAQETQNKACHKTTIGTAEEPGPSHNWSADAPVGNCKLIQFKIKCFLNHSLETGIQPLNTREKPSNVSQ